MDLESVHHALNDIKDYFRECRKNARQGGAADRRFDRYIEAVEEADKLILDQTGRRYGDTNES